ncbi:MAG TPA: hypothetical protein VE825_15180 [Terriglobales bacterium]|jgi:hypothetical protein|nr:hypothetical protein [Terriglobales bacterium]
MAQQGKRAGREDSSKKAMAGEFAVLSQLALHGLVANLTLGNTKGVDILVLNPKNKRMYQLEVKTRFRKDFKKSRTYGGQLADWLMWKKNENLRSPNLFYCFVNIDREDAFRYFLVPSKTVANYVRREHRQYMKHARPSADNDICIFRLREERNRKGWLSVPLASKYESKWGLLK